MAATIRAGIAPASIVLASVIALLPCAALAQRNGDVRNGRDYQPTTGEVQSRERAAGVALPPQQQQARTGQVDSIYRQLMSQEPQAAQAAPSAGVR